MDNYFNKIDYLLKHQRYQCPLCKGKLRQDSKLDLHHLLPKTYGNLAKYKRFINSLLNLVVVHNTCHIHHGNTLKIQEVRATQYESFLRMHPMIADFVNGVF
jgi:transposase-like protein